MSTKKTSGGFPLVVSALAIVICLVIGVFIFKFILGAASNFEGGDAEKGHPHNILGTMYKGGFIVPILIGFLLTVITFALERFFTIMKAGGSGATDKFVAKIKELISNHDFDGAIAECNRQKGSLANVVHEGILKYQFVQNDTTMDKEAKVHAIQKALEEATSLELPMLSKNMVVISTMASIGTLAGLIGTVVGMIRAFAALSAAGAPDTSALATGISEALVNTLVGILTSACAIIFYNYFSNRIDQITYAMDEAGYSIIGEFQSSGK
ncbi:MotA/TolQ/ExbB proton channel family protein [Sediminibacterium sp.]|uniref:MotA/TolQ/ExbB proton channel family protein n=1 Tax=Sediminibacterium sp. TaxID=1917865 RepID=UPI0027284D72|nr:MotA/TolQ/ExbB proton channel family protein [Sediminibacterium sp.]MDO9000483.1 MotA/TolQ/ExbB proton channel family protein [Bacteroidota bacterium]MDP3146949.1 MotA/TolQ/ExbB proton channel family protein [Bacteroidota bacterium]MDP3567513.1 MotA/TolQ/ExbB proton channel family protein [Sediminibacterium sp.]